MEEVKKMLNEIVEHCGRTSTEDCKAGRCKYSHRTWGCIFEAMEMNSPYDWDLEAGEDDSE